MGEFLEMGGYGAYVWPAYGLTAVILVALAINTLRDLRQNQRRFESLGSTKRRQRRPTAKPGEAGEPGEATS